MSTSVRHDEKDFGPLGEAFITVGSLSFMLLIAVLVMAYGAMTVVFVPTIVFEAFGVPYGLDVQKFVNIMADLMIFLGTAPALVTVVSMTGAGICRAGIVVMDRW